MATLLQQQARLHPDLALLTPSSNDWHQPTRPTMHSFSKGLAASTISELEVTRTDSSYSSSNATTADYLTSQVTTPETSPPASVFRKGSKEGSLYSRRQSTDVEDMTRLRPATAFDRRRSSVLDVPAQFQPKQSIRNSQSLQQLRERSRVFIRKTSSWTPNASTSPSRAAPPSAQSSAPPAKSTVLDKLPAHLWGTVISIGDLSPADGASLALASKSMHAKIGSSAFSVLKRTSSRTEKLRFLNYFHTFYPNDVLCPHCLTFHNPASPSFTAHECVRRRTPKALIFENRELAWWQVQQLVKASLPTSHFETSSRHTGGFDNRCEVRIVNSRALFKVTSRIQLRNIGRSSTASRPPTCAHICGSTIDSHLEKVKCWWSSKKRNLMSPTSILRCERCPTEYSLAVERKAGLLSCFRGADTLVMTRYFDAGDGTGMAGDEWFNLTYAQCDFSESENPRPKSPVRTMRGSGRKPFDLGALEPVKARFEGDGVKLEVKSIMC